MFVCYGLYIHTVYMIYTFWHKEVRREVLRKRLFLHITIGFPGLNLQKFAMQTKQWMKLRKILVILKKF